MLFSPVHMAYNKKHHGKADSTVVNCGALCYGEARHRISKQMSSLKKLLWQWYIWLRTSNVSSRYLLNSEANASES